MLAELDDSSLQTILVFLVSGVLGIAAAKALRLSPILGFFLVGAVVGPHGLELLDETGTFKLLAELGVAFLLFDVGTHLSFRRLWNDRRDLFALGGAQVAVTTVLLAGVGLLCGLAPAPAFVLGAGASLSSTALVLQALKDRGETGSPLEQRAVSVLVFQDLFIVLLLAILPVLGDGGPGLWASVTTTGGKVAAAVVLVSLIGRFLLQPAFRWITATRNDELFVLSALAFVIAVAFGVHALGLSLTLGAFLAGLALSESRYSFLVRAEVAPFRALLLSLFFLSVGMSLPVEVFVSHPLVVLGLTAALIAIKTAAIWGIGRVSGFCPGFALRFGLTLSQGSEFTFVLLGIAAATSLADATALGVVAAVVSASLALTPLLVRLGAAVATARERQVAPATAPVSRGKVVLVGFPDAARRLAAILGAAEVEYVAFTSDRDVVATARCQGYPVEFGSPDRPHAIGMATVGEATAVVSFVPDPHVARQIAEGVQRAQPGLPTYVVTDDPGLHAARAGAATLHRPGPDTDVVLARAILLTAGRSEDEVEALLARLREGAAEATAALVPSVH